MERTVQLHHSTSEAGRFPWLWLLTGVFLILGIGYLTLTPVFENSDETLHYPYAKHLADGYGLPLAVPGQLWNQEGTQPPLYYALVAAATFWIDTDNLPELLQSNPHWLFTEVRALINDNQNLVLHGPMDRFPYYGAALAVYLGRGLSLGFGVVAVIFTFLVARELFPDQPSIAIMATALTALTPQFIRVSATVSNDSLATALTTLTVWAALKFTAPRTWSIPEVEAYGAGQRAGSPFNFSLKPPLLLGLLCGLALLTKLSSLSTAFLAAYIILWRLFFLGENHQAPLRLAGRWLLIIGGIMLLLSGWWFWRNYQLYGEWLAVETHLNLAGRGNLSLADVWRLRAEIERAYWATFGWGQIRPPEPVYQLLGWFTRLGLVGLGLAMIFKLVQGGRTSHDPLNDEGRRMNDEPGMNSPDSSFILHPSSFEIVLFLLFWVALNLALYLRWVMEVGSVSHTRLIFPAITAISLLLALGWQVLLPRRFGLALSVAVMASLLALNIYSLGWLIYPAFRPGQPATVAGFPTPEAALDLTFLDQLRLITGDVQKGVDLQPFPTPKRNAARPGEIVTIRAAWQAVAPMAKNYSVAALLLAPDGQVLARRESYPGLGLRPTRYLAPGDSFVDLYPLQLSGEITTPLVARAVVNLFDLNSETQAGFPALNSRGETVTPVVGYIKLVPNLWPEYRPQNSTEVDFGGAIRLLGYDFDRSEQHLTLYWQSLNPVEEDLQLFIHLLDQEGGVLAQADAPPTQGFYPTSWWAPGEVVADSHLLPAVPGVKRLRLGFYSLNSGERLPVTRSTLPHQDEGVEVLLP